ncbi:MAG: protein kinase [Polyangiaceae bacterium]
MAASADPVELTPGSLFADRYEIGPVLGRGGMGAVWSARDQALGETIALKVMRAGEAAATQEVLRFRQEVRLARRVTHPNVARVFDIGEHAGLLYLTMELVPGETLRQLLRREGKVEGERAIRIALALCEGLRAAHAASVVHRDLKPANVMLGEGGRVVITDFGIARALDDSAGLTAGVIGTPSYMAPEQLVAGAVDARTDIYALGLVLYEMVAGERLQGAPRAGLPPAIDRLVRWCTAPMADARPASIDEVQRALRSALEARTNRPENKPNEDDVRTVTRPEATPRDVDSRRAEAAPRDADPRRAEAAARDVETRQIRTPIVGASGAPALTSGAFATGAGLLTSGGAVPSLAVLPFRYRGPRDQDDFGDAIADELVDVLARTRGLRVLGTGATARYKDSRDPRQIGFDLAANALIDGTAQVSGERVRITVRLVETASGVQLWSERYEGDLGDLLGLQETIARRVAEELRVELTTLVHRASVPAAAIELYLQGRHKLRAFDGQEAVTGAAVLDQCVAIAPDFAPALAARAIARIRRWFFDVEGGDWEASARKAVAEAIERGLDIAEAHLAAGILATQDGHYREAARSIERALAIAPTYADAHEYLGMLQCEAGQADEGTRRLRLATSLDPTLIYAGIFLARTLALQGKWDRAEAELAGAEARVTSMVLPLSRALRCRLAAWRRDVPALRRMIRDGLTEESVNRRVVMIYARTFAGEIDLDEARRALQRVVSATQNARMLSLTEQLATEVFAGMGQLDEARLHLHRAATNVLVDLEWLDRCPLLDPLRAFPDWDSTRKRVRTRAEAVWAT